MNETTTLTATVQEEIYETYLWFDGVNIIIGLTQDSPFAFSFESRGVGPAVI
jgi:hypothetical protein